MQSTGRSGLPSCPPRSPAVPFTAPPTNDRPSLSTRLTSSLPRRRPTLRLSVFHLTCRAQSQFRRHGSDHFLRPFALRRLLRLVHLGALDVLATGQVCPAVELSADPNLAELAEVQAWVLAPLCLPPASWPPDCSVSESEAELSSAICAMGSCTPVAAAVAACGEAGESRTLSRICWTCLFIASIGTADGAAAEPLITAAGAHRNG